MKMRVLIVDDEPPARRRIRTLLRGARDVEIAGECGDGKSALAAITGKRPDVVFLDVQMPELDGFGVLERLSAAEMPVVIFVTAYDQYALKAFEAHALDYLLKPFARARFEKALERARLEVARRGSGDFARRVVELLREQSGRRAAERIVVKTGGRVFFVPVEEIDWIEAEGNYVRIHTGGESHMIRETMAGMEGRLDAARFLRIHRSTLVNIERVKELQPWSHGDYAVVLRDGTKLMLSRTYKGKVEERLGQEL